MNGNESAVLLSEGKFEGARPEDVPSYFLWQMSATTTRPDEEYFAVQAEISHRAGWLTRSGELA